MRSANNPDLRMQYSRRKATDFYLSRGWDFANRNTGADVLVRNNVYIKWDGVSFKVIERRGKQADRRNKTDFYIANGYKIVNKERTVLGNGKNLMEWDENICGFGYVETSPIKQEKEKGFIPDNCLVL